MAVINFTSILMRGERASLPLPFMLHPAALVAFRTLQGSDQATDTVD